MKNILLIIFSFIATIVVGQDSLKNGHVVFYYNTGKISSEGIMKDGKPDGYWKSFYPSGTIKSEGNRKNHLLDSTWIFYSLYEDTMEKINFILGKRNGYSFTYNFDREDKPENIGKIIAKELYVNDKKEGDAYYYYNDGRIMKISSYRNNLLNGKTYEYDRNGTIITILTYSKGNIIERERINRVDENELKQGIWMEFDNNLIVKKEVEFKNDRINGTYKEFNEKGEISLLLKYEDGNIIEDEEVLDPDVEIKNEYSNNGNLIFSGTYRNNIPVGLHRKYDDNGDVINSYIYSNDGILLSEGIVDKDGKKEGKWKYFYSDGKLKAEGNYISNLENGSWKFYFNDGSIEQNGEYKNGKYNGLWKWYYPGNQVKKEENYFNGKEEGESIEYNEFGEVIAKGEFFEGEPEGEWYYFVNDHKEIGSYVTGLRHGKWKYYYENDVLQFEGEYIQGNPDGKHKYYYPNGELKEEQYYTQGIREKHWKKYDESGEVAIVISYKDDNEVRINGVKVDLPNDEKILIR